MTRLLLLAALFWAALAPAALAATEHGDAGELPASAQDLGADPALDAIAGTVESLADRDVYRVCLSGSGFSASTVGGADFDTQLFLLDAAGRGVYANDEAAGASGQSQLPADHPLSPTAAGVYYLAVSRFNQDPLDASEAPLFADVNETTGPLSSEPIAGWSSGREGAIGPYRIALSGVVACPAPDTTAPAIELRAPADGAVYTLGQQVAADYACSDEPGGSGVAACEGDVAPGAAIDTSTIGAHEFTVRAHDAAGNARAATVRYGVVYAFEGFLAPIENRPAVNRVRAGEIVRVRFRLGGFHGHDVLARGYPRSAEVACGSGEEPDPAEAEPTSSGWWWGWWWKRGLRYRHSKDYYEYRWRSERGWAGDCRQLIVKLEDGTIHRADFEFVRKRGRPHWR